MFGTVAGLLVAAAVGAYQVEEHNGGSRMGGMMQGMKPMMGAQNPASSRRK